jgi:hypothetical protein
VESEIAIADDIAEYMKEKGIKYDTSRDDAIALAATQQSDEVASVDEMNRLINQGPQLQEAPSSRQSTGRDVERKDRLYQQAQGCQQDNFGSCRHGNQATGQHTRRVGCEAR